MKTQTSLCSLPLSLETPDDVRSVAYTHRILKRLAKALIRMHVFAGWSEALLVAHITLLKISCRASYGPRREKTYLRGVQITKEQTSLRVRAVWSAPLLFVYWKSIISRLIYIWAAAWDFQQCGMCDQQSLRSVCAYAYSNQSLSLSLEYSMTVKLLTWTPFRVSNLKRWLHRLVWVVSVAKQAGLNITVSETPMAGLLASRPISTFEWKFIHNKKYL